MNENKNKALVMLWIEEGWNQGNMEIADDIFAQNFTAKGMIQGEENIKDVDKLKEYVKDIRRAFPDIHFSIEDLVAEGDKVVGIFSVEGTHTHKLWGISPTGNKVKFTAIDVWRVENGKIVERCFAVADFLSALQQMGVVPELG